MKLAARMMLIGGLAIITATRNAQLLPPFVTDAAMEEAEGQRQQEEHDVATS